MTYRLAPVALTLLLGGCYSETANLGAPPPVLLANTRTVIMASGNAIGRARLHEGILSVAEGQPQSVRAEIHMRGPRGNEAVRRELVALGLDPARLQVQPLQPGATGPSNVVLSRKVAATIPCAAAIEPGTYGDPSPSLLSLARCQQNNNLAQMLADPADLAAPPRLAPQDGAYLVSGVQAWRAGRATALPTQDTTVGNYDAGGGGGAGGSAGLAAPAATAPLTAGSSTATPATVTPAGGAATGAPTP